MSTPPRYSLVRFLSVLWLSAAAGGTPVPGRDLVSALRSGGYVILMRHASSPVARPDRAAAHADNVQRERQLDEGGRASAQAMGAALRRLKIPVGQILSSPAYRALETLRAAQLGPAQTVPELSDGGESMRRDDTGQRGPWLHAHVAALAPSGTNTVIVTHFPNIREAFPEESTALDDGEALILKPDGHGGVALLARVKINDWAQFPTF